MVPVNLQRLRRSALDDEDFLADLVRLFLSDSASQMLLLQAAIAGRKKSDAVRIAHRLKGSSANMGAERLARLFGELEGAGGRNENLPLVQTAEKVQAEYDRVCNYLRQLDAFQSEGGMS